MTLLSPTKTIGIFEYIEGSHETTRPAASNWGTVMTPGNNTWGTAVQVGSDVVEDLWAIEFVFTGGGVSTATKSTLVQIGFDFSGGTTFPASPDRYNSITLLVGATVGYNVGRGTGFWFPLGIPAGTAILMRASTENATVGSVYGAWTGWGRPKYPEATRRGQYVESLGAVEATSRGTAVTPGTTSEGTAVLLGTIGTDHPCWYWEFGFSPYNDTTQTANAVHCDLLAGSATGDVILQNGYAYTNAGEALCKLPSIHRFPYADVPGNTGIYGRAQASGTLDANYGMMANGVGG